MKARGEILLVSCYELGRQPLGIAAPLAHLEAAGFAPAALDLAVERAPRDAIERAKLIAVSVPMHTALRLGVRFAERVRRENPGAHVSMFGLYAALNAAWLRAHGVDSVIAGEVEGALVELARALEEGREPETDTRVVKRIARVAPSRVALPVLERYAKLERDGETVPAAAVEASRGCLHLCTHCPIPPVYGGRFFAVDAEVVLADIARVVEDGARHVTFADPDFLNGPAHAERIVTAMHERFPGVTFDFTAKVEHLLRHRELLPRFAEEGCLFVVSAVESLSPRVLSILEKGHTREDVEEALSLCERAGIALRPSLLPFTPWTTLEDYRDLVRFAARLGTRVDPVQLTIRLLVPPGSRLEAHPEFLPHRGTLDAAGFRWSWTHPDPRVDALCAEVGAVAAEGATRGDGPETILARIARVAGVELEVNERMRRAPRLTEPWFC